ncbi:Cof-type HAD-IIB family hydrolase [Spiroplasma chrysopicola]|uniref:HAD superfamily hydrolase n=1 Tax=Spiroplasma chrysopicola DF-1 TaxID=1276227 RepID=R4U0D6_9MOLU|nr:Cof-type HAD-IIB family hydrolase [Spiroplasma chrysopicola]AGM24692.1 HAD superfamily hydrolase [Spiroplasma chrysopicola DF-1]
MQKYKLIALDLDGTTVKSRNKISKKNQRTIKWALENDIKVVIATGRSLGAMRKVIEKLKLAEYNMPVVSFNGSVIYDVKNDKIIKHNYFETKEAITFFEQAKKDKVSLWAYSVSNDKLAYINNKNSLMVKWMSFHTHRKTRVFSQVKNFNDQIYKFVISGKKANVFSFRKTIENNFECNIFDWSYVSKSNLNLEICPVTSDKKHALEFIAKKYNIAPEEIIAMGDGSNDIEMLKWAGLGIAMGNAKKQVKAIANDVTAHHKKSGVAKAIEKHVKIQ